MILVCYDGSADAQAAVDRAAQLMSGAEATVLTVWEPFLDTMVRSGSVGMGMGMGLGGMYQDNEKMDEDLRKTALESATEGAQRASAAGLVAQPRIASRHGGIAEAILAVASELDAAVVALGTRGLGGVKSVLLGSVSHALMQHADRPVLVVPSAELAGQRHVWARAVDPAAEPA